MAARRAASGILLLCVVSVRGQSAPAAPKPRGAILVRAADVFTNIAAIPALYRSPRDECGAIVSSPAPVRRGKEEDESHAESTLRKRVGEHVVAGARFGNSNA